MGPLPGSKLVVPGETSPASPPLCGPAGSSLVQYTFRYDFVVKPVKGLALVDALSRAPNEEPSANKHDVVYVSE